MTQAVFNRLRSYLYYPSALFREGGWEIRKVAGHGKKRYHVFLNGTLKGRFWTIDEARENITWQ